MFTVDTRYNWPPKRGTVTCPECKQRYCNFCELGHSMSLSCRDAEKENTEIIEKQKENFVKNLNLMRDTKKEDGKFKNLSDVTIHCVQ